MNTSTRLATTTDAVNNLTGRIAHEFSNVLTIVLAKADLLADGLSPDDAGLLADLEDLRRAARRGADLTDRMLSYARRHPLDLQDLDLTSLVAAATPTLAGMLPEGLVLAAPTTAVRGRYRIRADEAAVQRILLNLIANARDAMPTGGTVTITLERESAADGQDTVSIVVSDTGSGIAPGIRDRVFEPFFTTRDPGRGTGLGLSLVHSLMHQHGGTASLEADLGQGAGVRVTFPALPVMAGDTGAAPCAGGLILIAEDEEIIRRSAKRVLERFGYTVLLAADGVEALERMIERGPDIDLVISDMVMPHLDGTELHRKARERGYPTPFLFMSGYQPDELWRTVADDPTLDFLPKPWTVAELVARVHALIGNGTPMPTAGPGPGR